MFLYLPSQGATHKRSYIRLRSGSNTWDTAEMHDKTLFSLRSYTFYAAQYGFYLGLAYDGM